MEATPIKSLSGRVLSMDSSATQFPRKPDRGKNLVENPISSRVLHEDEIESSHQRRERLDSFVKRIG